MVYMVYITTFDITVHGKLSYYRSKKLYITNFKFSYNARLSVMYYISQLVYILQLNISRACYADFYTVNKGGVYISSLPSIYKNHQWIAIASLLTEI